MHRRTAAWIVTLTLTLVAAPLALAAEDKPEPDPSKVMVFIESSPKFPGAQKKAGGPLEQLAGITPQTAKQHLAFAMHKKENFDFGRDGFQVKIVSDMAGEAALKSAEEHGVGSVLLVTVLRRAVKDIGQSEMLIEVEASYHLKASKAAGWSKKYAKQFKAESQGYEGNRRIHDTDVIAKTMEDLLREMLFKYAIPHRVRSADLRGTPRTITAQVTNSTTRTIASLEMEVPHGRGESFLVESTDAIPPGEQRDVTFTLQNDDPSTAVVWTKGKLVDVHFEGDRTGDVAAPGAERRPTLKERLEALRKRRANGGSPPPRAD